jgi:2-desacetyl-2-hydroxyethyl bacteriochlorophyllide A dehydrogenase
MSSENRMRAVRAGNGSVEVREVPAPDGPGVRVDVKAAGICGTDLHLVSGDDFPPPRVTLGHEIAGVTENGTPVAIEPLAPCSRCDPCRRGDEHLCAVGSAMLFGVGLDGGMADRIVVPERCLVPLPAGVAVRDASLVEPLAVVVHSLRRSAARPDQRVVVIGGGTIGLCAVAAARARGCDVALVARHDAQRAAGERLGATAITDTAADGGYDIVIEAAGSESALRQAVGLARPGGTVVIPGVYWGPVAMPGLAMCLKEVSLCPTALYSRTATGRDIDAAAALLATTPGLADTLITHRFPLEAAAEAFATAASRDQGAIKVVLEP